MKVNGTLDVTSAQSASSPSKSKGSSTANDSLFGSILGQKSQGSGKTTRDFAAKQARTSNSSEAVKGADATANKPSKSVSQKQQSKDVKDAVESKDPKDVTSDQPEDIDAAPVDDTSSTDKTDGTDEVKDSAEQEPTEDGAKEDTGKDEIGDEVANQQLGIKIFVQPAPIPNIQTAVDATAPPVIQVPVVQQQAVEIPAIQDIATDQQLMDVIPEEVFDPQVETALKTATEQTASTQQTASIMEELQTVAQQQTVTTDQEIVLPAEEPVLEVIETDLDVEPETQSESAPVAPETSKTSSKAETFAAQVVKEAKELVEEQTTEPKATTAEMDSDGPMIVQAEEETAPDDGDASSKKDDSEPTTKQTTHQNNVNTAQVADNGKVDFRLSGAQPLEAQQNLPPEIRDFNMSRVVDQVRTEITPDKTEFYVQLKPDHLGGLSIALVSEDKGVVAKLMTSSQQVHNALQADMTQMIQMLRDKGINVVSMEVIYDQTANSMMQQDGNQHQQQSTHSNNSRSHGRVGEIAEDALSMYDTLSSYEVLTEQGGSVEYSA